MVPCRFLVFGAAAFPFMVTALRDMAGPHQEALALPAPLVASPQQIGDSKGRPYFSDEQEEADHMVNSSPMMRQVSRLQIELGETLKRIQIFPKDTEVNKDGDEGWQFFLQASGVDWAILIGSCIMACLLDFCVFQRLPNNLLWHGIIIVLWVAIALLFNVVVLFRMGGHRAVMWMTGYLLEWMLSMDNLFVFHLVFSAYQTPANQIHKAVFVGITGAILMRMVFFMVLSELLSFFGWMRWPFGLLLVWSGIEAARSDDDDDTDVKDTRLVRSLKWLLGDRLRDSYDEEGSVFVKDEETGKIQVTLLFIVIVCVEVADVVFALDSVSAKVAQLPDSYAAFSSSVLAMFGLRAMFFVINDLVDMFEMLKYGLCLILVFIGIELMFSKFIHLASSTVCILIMTVFAVCIAASSASKCCNKKADQQAVKNVDDVSAGS